MNYHNVQFEAAFGTSRQLPKSSLPEIAFSGRSNVGKSSMINKVFNRKQLARVSSMPGKTATINFFRVDDIRFADLPGYGYAKVSKSEKRRWAELIEGYFHQDRNLYMVFQLIDIRHKPTADDLTMLNFLIDEELPFVIILTKRDKLSKRQFEERMKAFQEEIPYADQITMIPFSAQTGEGVEQIKEIVNEIERDAIEYMQQDISEEQEISSGYADELDDTFE
ncbi:ribosome biogenesis GTP-binding protein YihA/YsxC [Youxingia wuxianensis]|uniref:Probable GTP-binding protein EngB n=1 Tax=Youxingia wuxianensis TaxID=2763678 RepID=A0A926IBG4_9FIRM|nr:ribosome biogenesis GTP-binding protein YihA/YsxC [Youxingia wuxianensis]MBC8584067.1 YihA family ribosome biogenesis GTP-binding protein [Youxingia wuxianensis]